MDLQPAIAVMFLAEASSLGKMHLQILHFPIALAMMAVVADLLWVITRRGIFKASGTFLIVAAAVMSIPTVIAGDNLMDSIFGENVPKVGQAHATLGVVTMSVLLLAAVFRLIFIKSQAKWWPWVYGLLIVSAACLAGLTAHLGGAVAWPTMFTAAAFFTK
jgi:uncharacterized membrane protein